MALSGPRLDRPSAIGEEARPRTVSLWIATIVVAAVVGVGGLTVGQPGLLPTLGTMVGLTVAGVGLVDRERFGPQLVGYVAFVLFGSFLVLNVGVLLVAGAYGLATAGAALALFGLGATWADAATSESVQRTLGGTLLAYGVMIATLTMLAILASVLLVGGATLRTTTAGLSPGPSVIWFVLVVGYAAGSLRVALWALPVEQLTSRRRRPTVEAYLDAFGRVTLVTAIASPLALTFVSLVVMSGAFDSLPTSAPLVAAALDLLAAPPILGTLGTVGTFALLATLSATLLRLATRRFDTTTVRWVAASSAGVVLAVLLVMTVAFAVVLPALGTVTTALTALLALLFLPTLLIAIGTVWVVGTFLGLLPDRAGGPAVAATGMVLAAVGFGRATPALVFACVGAAVVVWDMSWFGLGLTAELGLVPETRRIELFHGVVVLGVGLASVLVLWVAELLRTTAFAGVGNTVALYVVGAGIVLLLLPLRG